MAALSKEQEEKISLMKGSLIEYVKQVMPDFELSQAQASICATMELWERTQSASIGEKSPSMKALSKELYETGQATTKSEAFDGMIRQVVQERSDHPVEQRKGVKGLWPVFFPGTIEQTYGSVKRGMTPTAIVVDEIEQEIEMEVKKDFVRDFYYVGISFERALLKVSAEEVEDFLHAKPITDIVPNTFWHIVRKKRDEVMGQSWDLLVKKQDGKQIYQCLDKRLSDAQVSHFLCGRKAALGQFAAALSLCHLHWPLTVDDLLQIKHPYIGGSYINEDDLFCTEQDQGMALLSAEHPVVDECGEDSCIAETSLETVEIEVPDRDEFGNIIKKEPIDEPMIIPEGQLVQLPCGREIRFFEDPRSDPDFVGIDDVDEQLLQDAVEAARDLVNPEKIARAVRRAVRAHVSPRAVDHYTLEKVVAVAIKEIIKHEPAREEDKS